MAPRRLPSFVKILLHPSDSRLQLPPAFVHRHLKNKIPEHPILQSVNGGYSWSLKIRRIDENYCFADGWNNVVEDSQLGFGDFLVFWLVDQSTFKLSIFSPNGCGKHFPSKIHIRHQEEDGDGGGDEEEDDDGYCRGDGDPFFMRIVSKHKYSMRVPPKFVRLTGIDVERIITIKNLDGKEWQLKLRSDKSNRHSTRYFLSAGWIDFRRGNELSEGDKCVFKFIRSEDKICLAKVTKKTEWAEQPASKVPAAWCEEKFPSNIHIKHEEEDEDGGGGGRSGGDQEEDDGDDGGDDDLNGGDPFFKKIITRDHKFTMRLPSEFLRLAGLNAERIIAMKNLDGKEWHMRLRLEKCTRRYIRYSLSAGWSDFRQANELSEGDECVFKFIKSEDKLCLAKVTKKTVRPKQTASEVPATEVFEEKKRLPPRVAVEKRPCGWPPKQNSYY